MRRAWLCGVDALTGRSFDHRRDWVEYRLLELAGIFAVSLYVHAVMSNHTHLALRVDPAAAQAWSDEEVGARWVRLFPACTDGAAAARQVTTAQSRSSPESIAGVTFIIVCRIGDTWMREPC